MQTDESTTQFQANAFESYPHLDFESYPGDERYPTEGALAGTTPGQVLDDLAANLANAGLTVHKSQDQNDIPKAVWVIDKNNNKYVLKWLNVTRQGNFEIRVAREMHAHEILKGLPPDENIIGAHGALGSFGVYEYVLLEQCSCDFGSWAQKHADGLSLKGLVRILHQIMRGLAVLHGIKLNHRDIQPGNLLLVVDNDEHMSGENSSDFPFVIKISDFGISTFLISPPIYPVSPHPRYLVPPELASQVEHGSNILKCLPQSFFHFTQDVWSAVATVFMMIFPQVCITSINWKAASSTSNAIMHDLQNAKDTICSRFGETMFRFLADVLLCADPDKRPTAAENVSRLEKEYPQFFCSCKIAKPMPDLKKNLYNDYLRVLTNITNDKRKALDSNFAVFLKLTQEFEQVFKDKCEIDSLAYFYFVDGLVLMQNAQRVVADCVIKETATTVDMHQFETYAKETEEKYELAFRTALGPGLKLNILNGQAMLVVEKIRLCRFEVNEENRRRKVLGIAEPMLIQLKAAIRTSESDYRCYQFIYNMINIVLEVHQVIEEFLIESSDLIEWINKQFAHLDKHMKTSGKTLEWRDKWAQTESMVKVYNLAGKYQKSKQLCQPSNLNLPPGDWMRAMNTKALLLTTIAEERQACQDEGGKRSCDQEMVLVAKSIVEYYKLNLHSIQSTQFGDQYAREQLKLVTRHLAEREPTLVNEANALIVEIVRLNPQQPQQ